MSAVSARSATSPATGQTVAKREKDQAGEIWITEATEQEQSEAAELGLLRANASMLGNWESCNSLFNAEGDRHSLTRQWRSTGWSLNTTMKPQPRSYIFSRSAIPPLSRSVEYS